ncbi:MAG: pyridoxine 5'-phosphate synthase [Gemmataceae bacterium]|nr:pyridoxine 5'-phosphate synthase [Gemmataceae bacterium]
MIRLGVNIDHVATLRQARLGLEPDPVAAAMEAVLGGADGITVHLREDRRHIQERDVRILRQMVPCGLNLEMAVSRDIIAFACEILPEEATLVPEKREELTTEGGLDVLAHLAAVEECMGQLKDRGIMVSLFIDPDPRQIEAAHRLGSYAVEFQTASYSEAKTATGRAESLQRLVDSSRMAASHGIHVHMGHGLNYQNVFPIAAIPQVEELNIGHSIVARSVLVGMRQAVIDMKGAIAQGRNGTGLRHH